MKCARRRTPTCDLGIRNPDQGDTEKHQEVPSGNGIKDLDWSSSSPDPLRSGGSGSNVVANW